MMENQLLDNLWFLSRVVVGWMIHASLIVFALFNVEITYEIVKDFYVKYQHSTLFSPQLIGIIAAISVFFAMLSGVFFVKQAYIRYALPEVMDEITRKILK